MGRWGGTVKFSVTMFVTQGLISQEALMPRLAGWGFDGIDGFLTLAGIKRWPADVRQKSLSEQKESEKAWTR
jgi:hypothetical protein